MNDTANTAYTFGMATGEILTLLLLSFLIGMVLCWVFREIGICCRARPKYQPTVSTTPINKVKISVPETKLHVVPSSPTLPSAKLHLPEAGLPKAELDMPQVNLDLAAKGSAWTTNTLAAGGVTLAGLALGAKEHPEKVELHAPNVELPEVEPPTPSVELPKVELPTPNIELPEVGLHKPSVGLPEVELPTPGVELPEVGLHKPTASPRLLDIDPHKPIIAPPDMEVGIGAPDVGTPAASTSNRLGDWLHKAKDSVEHLAEKASPSAQDWLHKAKDSVENLAEKATPSAQDWLNKAKDSVEHLAEKASPAAQDWLHKAKEIGSDLSSKGSALTATAGGITLAGLTAGAKGLTEKLTSNLHLKQDDLCKLEGIGPTFEAVLNRAGIYTYQQLADTTAEHLRGVLDAEDAQFHTHDPSSWPQQAALAATGEWEKLKEYQATL